MNETLGNSLSTHPDHLYTWLDVNNYFAELARDGRWPSWLQEVDGYWDSVRFSVDSSTAPAEAWNWLVSVLGPLTVDRERQVLLLDDDGHERPLTIEFVNTADAPPPGRQPRWTNRRIVAELARPLPAPHPTTPHDMPLVAFHSFKGGVGRTLHCVAAARRLADSGKRVLLIDADLEAPGITWMVTESIRNDFAYEDFLALVHGSLDQSFQEAISLGRKFLANQELDGVVVMPARRDRGRITPTQIEPVDLLTTDRDPYVLTEALAELGHALGVDAVLVDLRAGASELSAPLLLDPRVFRVFVTTISDQSVRGTVQILRELAKRAPARQQNDPDCGLVVTQFNPLDHDGRLAAVATELRSEAMAVSYKTDVDGDQVDADVAIPVISSRFDPNLLNLPGSWPEVVRLTTRSGLADLMGEVVDTLPFVIEMTSEAPPAPSAGVTADTVRARLARVAEGLVYAEQSGHHDFLPTEALRGFAQAHRTELPVEVVIGSKGAGKTFTYLQLCTRPTWAAFAEAAGVVGSALAAPTIAVLASTSLKPEVEKTVNEFRETAARQLTGQPPAPFLAIRELVGEALHQGRTPGQWRRLWLTCFGRSLGLDVTDETAEAALTNFAGQHSAVFVLDGLENLFRNFVTDQQEQLALRALLVDCPEWLRTLRGRPLGLVAFVRRDLVRAIGHNVGQFEQRYNKYALKWNQEEALRLTAWVCQRGGALSLSDEDVRAATREALSQKMLVVWGDKMGTPKSREARSEVWFFAALSDFNQQIQARDIVSFLAAAAEESIGGDRWTDRILTPLAMRNSLPKCSKQKIESISEENEPVAKLLNQLRSLDPGQRLLPFQLDTVGLTSKDAELLEANGVVLAEDGQYWIPEIFRHGLNFAMRSGRRPRVLAVAHLVRRRNDVTG